MSVSAQTPPWPLLLPPEMFSCLSEVIMTTGGRVFRRKKREVVAASREREKSARRLRDSKQLLDTIERIKTENHFADAIVEGLLRGQR